MSLHSRNPIFPNMTMTLWNPNQNPLSYSAKKGITKESFLWCHWYSEGYYLILIDYSTLLSYAGLAVMIGFAALSFLRLRKELNF